MTELRIKFGDEMTGEEADQSWQYVHPLQQPEVRQYIAIKYPEFVELLDSLTFPQVSSNPDELEEWEAKQIKNRKKRFGSESDFQYLSRILYEECFSVTQNPGLGKKITFREVEGMTLGGMLSHFYTEVTFNRSKLGSFDTTPLNQDTFGNQYAALVEAGDREAANALLELMFNVVWPPKLGEHFLISHIKTTWRRKIRMGATEGYPEVLDSLAFRLVKVIKYVSAITEEIQDQKLKNLLKNPEEESFDRDLTKATFMKRFWHRCSQGLLDNGIFKGEDDEDAQEVVNNLLFLRTHPEMQIFFKYFSPSGYLNDGEIERKAREIKSIGFGSILGFEGNGVYAL